MPSHLSWLDHDSAARERSLRILALFQEKESRDELGIGGVRDAIADRLFPGTSTIQTRIRYMLLVAWTYRLLETEKVPAKTFGVRARQVELSMVPPLLDAREEGVFGRQAGSGLKRLPSSIYWAGLGAWGIRRFDGSQAEYHGSVDGLYTRRARVRRREDDDNDPDPTTATWHPRLPEPPAGFPARVDLTVSTEEASFLADRIVAASRDSLLAWLVLHGRADTASEPWLHHQQLDFPKPVRVLLRHARLFSDVVEGAARVYNLALAEQIGATGWADEHRAAIAAWQSRLDWAALDDWSLEAFWGETPGQGHTITAPTRRFVEAWTDRLRELRGDVADDAAAREMVRRREMALKGPRSRFTNLGALRQWGGNAGTGRLVYRWPTARQFLDDLLPGLAGR